MAGATPARDTDQLLKDTFGRKQPVSSGRLALAVNVDADGVAGLPSPLKIGLKGPFRTQKQGGKPAFDFDLSLGSKDGSVTLGAISAGGKSWLTVAGRAFTLQDSAFDSLVKGDPSTGAPPVDLSTFGVDPRRWLRDPKQAGTEDLDGDRVIHLTSDVDTEPLVADLDSLLGRAGGVSGAAAGISAAQRKELVKAITGANVDIWTGEKDHKLRRIKVDVDLKTPSGEKGTIELDLGVSQIDQKQAIGPPANPRPIAELTSALATLAARAGSGSAGGSGAASGSTGPTGSSGAQGDTGAALPENATQYDRCLAAAGANIAAAQRCADLVGK